MDDEKIGIYFRGYNLHLNKHTKLHIYEAIAKAARRELIEEIEKKARKTARGEIRIFAEDWQSLLKELISDKADENNKG